MEEKTAVGSGLCWRHSILWALLALLLTPVLLVVSGVEAMSGGSLVTPRPGEALVMCPLTVDVWQTKHDLVIRHFPYTGDAANVFGCTWLKKDPDNPDCRSYHNFTLVSLEKDYVTASIPRTQLHKNGSYKCQLVPPDDDEPYTRCLVLHSDVAEDPPTTISDQPQPSDPTGANGDHTGLLAVFLPLVLIFLVIVILMAVWISRLRGALGAKTELMKDKNPYNGTESENHPERPTGRKDKKYVNGVKPE